MFYIHFTSQILPSYRPSKAAIRKWNGQLFDAFANKLSRPKPEPVTVAGPPGCVDKPWWWGSA